MKKIFSILFSVAFLLVFVSSFSQKTLAATSQCLANPANECLPTPPGQPGGDYCPTGFTLADPSTYLCGSSVGAESAHCCLNNGGSGTTGPSCTGNGGTCNANVCPSGKVQKLTNGVDTYAKSCANPHPEQVPMCCFPADDGNPAPVSTGGSGTPPIGNFDSADCEAFSAWTCDADNYNQSLTVAFYDGPGFGNFIANGSASNNRQDLASVCGNTINHGVWYTTPDSLKDGKTHQIYAYAISIGPDAGYNPQIGSPISIPSCAPPPPACTTDLTCNPNQNSCDGSGATTKTCGLTTTHPPCTNAPDNCDTGYNCVSGACVLPPAPPPATPTPTPVPNSTILSLVIGLDGIGHVGDQVNADWKTHTNTAIVNGKTVTNPVAGSNQTPKTDPRMFTVNVNGKDYTNQSFAFDKTNGVHAGTYTGTVDLGTAFTGGSYSIKVSTAGHLVKASANITITAGTTTTVPQLNLVAGDINGDNALGIDDYNILLSCMNDADITNTVGTALCNQDVNYKIRADLEDNGPINKFDYNLWVREFKMIQAGD